MDFSARRCSISHGKETIDWIEENYDLICDWPANSPDQNPIELLWAILKNIMVKLDPKTVDELKQVLFQARNSISQATIRGLCRTFEARLWICLDLEGALISKHFWLCCDRSALTAWELEQMNPYVPWIAEEDSTLYHLLRTMEHNLRADAWAKRVPGEESVVFRPADEGGKKSP